MSLTTCQHDDAVVVYENYFSGRASHLPCPFCAEVSELKQQIEDLESECDELKAYLRHGR